MEAAILLAAVGQQYRFTLATDKPWVKRIAASRAR
jgi:hypothetical protein